MAADFEYTFTGKLSEDLTGLRIDYAKEMGRLFLPHADRILEITIKPFYKKRTLAQNRWIWGYVIPTVRAWMKENTGSCPSKDALYAFFRTHIIGDEALIEAIDGVEVITISGKHFSQCSTVEFSERAEKIIAYYGEQGLELNFPDPGSSNLITDIIRQQKERERTSSSNI